LKLTKEKIIEHVKKIRKEIGHADSEINIKELIYNETKNEMWIISTDRPDKSAIIGKGGWVVGRLREELEIDKIHVESHSDYLLKKYQMKLSLDSVRSFIKRQKNQTSENKAIIGPMENLKSLLEEKIKNIYNFDLDTYFTKHDYSLNEDYNPRVIVALSGGVDSSFSLVLAKKLGFNPLSVTIDPGTIILPKQFKKNINNLCKDLSVKHKYISVDYKEIIDDSLNGRFHPCGRCSDTTEKTLFNYGIENDIHTVIFGDMLSTGFQCITKYNIKTKGNIGKKELFRLNLPATLSIGKEEIKNTIEKYNLEKIKGFGCPLLYEVHKNYPHLKKFSIQRILRETRSGALEPGEALNLIWSFYKLK
jgi:uncharacterized protein